MDKFLSIFVGVLIIVTIVTIFIHLFPIACVLKTSDAAVRGCDGGRGGRRRS
ncbi:hypothetical protein FWI45_00950, partial [Francisella tularensis subsp. holarctica]|nr:hypothetical protein [Francisella tularensis subsp. holarctica]